jgi:hypothetical protein
MNRRLVVHLIQVVVVALTIVAVVQELSKSPEKRCWYGKILFIPYDFRLPTWERFRETYWNPYERHILTRMVWGLGWTVNFYALFENLGLIQPRAPSEESFLLPNKSMRQILRGVKE